MQNNIGQLLAIQKSRYPLFFWAVSETVSDTSQQRGIRPKIRRICGQMHESAMSFARSVKKSDE